MKHSARQRPSSPSGKGSKFKPRFAKDGGKKRFYTDKSKPRGMDQYPDARPPAKHVDTPPGTYVASDRDKKWNKGKRPFGKFQPKRKDDGPFSNTKLRPREETVSSNPRKTKDKPARDTVLIWGLHAARAAWLNPKRRCFRMWLTEAGKATFETALVEAKDALLKRPDAKIVDRHELERHTPPGSVHQGILLEVAPLHEPALHEVIGGDNPPDLLIMLDQVTDPHNVGAILRSAAAFGAGAVIMTERNAPIMTGVQAKAASGATEHVAHLHVVNLARALDELQKAGYWCVGLAEEGEKTLSALDLSGRTVVVLGNEGEGLRQLTRKKCDELARLPTGGPIGSLNVSNAAAVALYEIRRQKNKF
jgi:23S rRNA (guanosine2251-2'-O)-methyltransferase